MVREVLVKILANPALLRAMVVLFCAGFAFLIGVLFIRFLRQQIAEESDMGEDTPRSLDALPLHVYNTVIQQLKQQKHELMIQSQAEQQRTKSSEALNQAVLANVPCGVLIFGPNGLVRSINPAAKTILGFATMIGMSPEDIFRGALVRKSGSNAGVEEPLALASIREKSPISNLLLLSFSFGCRGVDHLSDFRNPIGREAALLRVFTHHLFIRRDIDAVDLILGDITLDPLNLRP